MIKKSIPIILIIILIAAGTVIAGYYVTQKSTDESRNITSRVASGEKAEQTNKPTSAETINTSDWKVYRNVEYDYQFKYPSDWIIFGPNHHISVVSSETEKARQSGAVEVPDDIHVSTFKRDSQSLDEFIESYNNGWFKKYNQKSEIVIDSDIGIQYSDINAPLIKHKPVVGTLLLKKDKIFLITYTEGLDDVINVYNLIISTFRTF